MNTRDWWTRLNMSQIWTEERFVPINANIYCPCLRTGWWSANWNIWSSCFKGKSALLLGDSNILNQWQWFNGDIFNSLCYCYSKFIDGWLDGLNVLFSTWLFPLLYSFPPLKCIPYVTFSNLQNAHCHSPNYICIQDLYCINMAFVFLSQVYHKR